MDSTKRFLIVIVACAFFMEGLDATIINTALPQIAYSLQTDPLHLKVALTAYLLAAGIVIPVSGWLADYFGCHRIFTSAVIIFLVGSIACGCAQNLTELVLARVIQGTGGALSLPIGRLLFMRNFSKTELVSAMSLTATFGLLGPSFGPLIGGALTTYVSWRAIFFVNIPIGLLGFYFAWYHIENIKNPDLKKFDVWGFLIISLSLAALLVGLDTIIDPLLGPLSTALLIAIGFCGLIVYVFYARTRDYAIISTRLFQNRTFAYVIFGSLFVRFSISAAPFLIPLLLQVGFAYSPMVSGIFTAAGAFGMLITKLFVSQTLKTFGHRLVLIISSLLFSVSLASLSIIALHPAIAIIFLLLLINGIIASMQFTAMNTLAYGSVAPALQASGSSFISSLQQIMSSFSIALSAMTLELFLHSHTILHTYSPPAFEHTFLVLALWPILSSIVFMKLPKSDAFK